MWQTIEYERVEKIGYIRLNRVKALNALNPQMMDELRQAFRAADDDDEIHVIVLGHNGPHFGAGYDLKENWRDKYKREETVLGARDMLRACVDFEFLPWDCQKPVLAMVRGYCLAGSCELAMMCCITFASETAKFGEPEIRFSASPPAVIMPWLVGLKKARELLYTGDYIDAQEALRLGMINRVFPEETLEEETFRYARRCAAISRVGLITTKASINRGAEIAGLRKAIDYGVEMGAMLGATPTEAHRKFEEITKKEGLGAAIRWRESQFE